MQNVKLSQFHHRHLSQVRYLYSSPGRNSLSFEKHYAIHTLYYFLSHFRNVKLSSLQFYPSNEQSDYTITYDYNPEVTSRVAFQFTLIQHAQHWVGIRYRAFALIVVILQSFTGTYIRCWGRSNNRNRKIEKRKKKKRIQAPSASNSDRSHVICENFGRRKCRKGVVRILQRRHD